MAQDFYKKNGSYFTTTGQKVANPTELQNLAKAGGKEIAMPSVPTGATKIASPDQLKGLTEQDIFRQGQDIYRLPSINTTLDAEEVAPDVPEPEAVNDVSSYTAGLDTTIKGLEENIKKINEPLPQEQEISEIRKRQGELSEEKAKVQETALPTAEEFGYTKYTKELQALMPQIAKVKAEYDNAEIAQEGRIGSASSIYGRRALIQRQRAVELAGLCAIAQAYQGNIELATQTAKDMVNMELAPIQTRIDDQKWQIEQVYEQLTSAEQKKADSLNLVLAERQRLLEEEKERKMNIANLGIQAAQNGADQATIEKIMNATDYMKAIKLASEYLDESQGTWEESDITDANGNPLLFNSTTGEYKNSVGTSTSDIFFTDANGDSWNIAGWATDQTKPAQMDRIAKEIGKLTEENLNEKVKEFAPGLTGDMIKEASAQSGVSWEAILTMVHQEATLNGEMSPVAKANNNFGGLKWSANTQWKEEPYNGVKGGTSESGDHYTKFPTKQQGLNAMANLMAQYGKVDTTLQQPDEVIGLVELVRTGQLTPKEALGQVSEKNRNILTEQLSKIEIEKVVSSYTEEMKNRTLESVDELLTQVNPYTVGFGVLAKGIPTSQARSFAAQLDTLKANIAFGELTAMREASKTGGALGQVSDREGKLLANALGALDQGQSPEQFKAQLEKIKNSINKWKQEVNQYSSQSNISTVDLSDLNFKFE